MQKLSQNTTSLCFAGNITLIGAGTTDTIIDGNHTATDTGLAAPVMFVGSNAPVEIHKVTIRDGNFSFGGGFGQGGGINNAGTLTVVDSIISDNFGASGGGIYNSGFLTVLRSRISRNLAGGGAFSGEGGGIHNNSFFQQSSVTVADSVINENTATNANGGGISNFQGLLTITGSTMSDNTADRGGGGIANFAGNFIGTLTVINSTISGNRGSSGGGIYTNRATVDLQTVTVANNIATTGSGGGIINSNAGAFTPRNTLIARNTAAVFGPDCFATTVGEAALASQGYNLIQDTSNCALSGDPTGNIPGQDPKLGVLTSNGGPTPTHALLDGSPAIDTGNPNPPGSSGFSCTTIDQRGILRPQGTACDIGAYETETFQGASLFIVPNHGGNTDSILALVYGSDVVNGATVKLTRRDQSIVGNPVVFIGTSLLSTSFDLSGKPLGVWDVVVTKPDGTSATIPGGFTIEDTHAPQLWADVIGRTDRIRVDRPERYTILFGNRGNVDAVAVPLVLTVPTNIALHLRFQFTPPPLQTGQILTDWSQVLTNPAIDGLIYIPLLLPVVPAGFTGTLEFTVTAPSASFGIPFEIFVEIGPSFLDAQGVDGLVDKARIYAQQVLGIDLPPSLNPQLGHYATTQLQEAVEHGRNTAVMNANTGPEIYSLPQLVADLAQFGAAQTKASTDSVQRNLRVASHTSGWPGLVFQRLHPQTAQAEVQATGWVGFIPPWLLWIFQPHDVYAKVTFDQCAEKGMYPNPEGTRCTPCAPGAGTRVLSKTEHGVCNPDGPKPTPSTSGDPNDKVGSLGVGTAHYLSGAKPLRYSILFENVDTADLPAQEVIVTDQLDGAKVDFNTFSLGPIAFGNITVTPPPGLSQYSTRVDLRPAQNLLVAIQAGLDKSSGLVTWRLTSVDPKTLELTDDPEAGFLPPNKNPPEGDGGVLFTIQPKVAGSTICNQASIVFDTNPAIATPQWCNTIDDSPPSSQVLTLSATQSSSSFLVEWSGTDASSGIAAYTIFVSENGGEGAAILMDTTDTSTMFTGMAGNSYAFYSVARDLVGNSEAAPAQPDTVTRVAEVGGEICGNCVDDDSDGRIDWPDADCEAAGLTVKKGVLNLVKPTPGDEKIALTGSFAPATIDPPTQGVTLSFLRPGTALAAPDAVLACAQIPPGAPGWKTNKTETLWTFKDTKGGPLGDPNSKDMLTIKYNAKKQHYEVTVAILEAEVGMLAQGPVSTQLSIGGQGWENIQTWRLKARGKQLVTP